MAGKGRRFTFHGAFGTAGRAESKARALKRRGAQAFVRKVKMKRRGTRHLVMVPRR